MLRKRCFQFLPFLLLALLSAVAQSDHYMPQMEHKVVLPQAAKGNVTVLVFGFTKASKTPTSAWARKLSADFGPRAGFELYQVPVLEDVPRLVRGMVISSMKKGTPEDMRDHFIPLFAGESELKKTVDFHAADDAYLVVLNRGGKVVRQMHGSPTEETYPALRGEIGLLLEKK